MSRPQPQRRGIDMADVVVTVGLVVAAGGLWWMTGHPGAALVVVGAVLTIAGLTAAF